jgi:hypothetical protein
MALDEPIPEWWEEVLVHLPPQPVTAPNANGKSDGLCFFCVFPCFLVDFSNECLS